MKKTNIVVSLTTAAALLVTLGSQVTYASDCKGLEASNCAAKSSCSWIDGYTRKDGRKVKSFCRAKPASKAKTALKKPNGQSVLGKAKSVSTK